MGITGVAKYRGVYISKGQIPLRFFDVIYTPRYLATLDSPCIFALGGGAWRGICPLVICPHGIYTPRYLATPGMEASKKHSDACYSVGCRLSEDQAIKMASTRSGCMLQRSFAWTRANLLNSLSAGALEEGLAKSRFAICANKGQQDQLCVSQKHPFLCGPQYA